jgi:hypothetical protein
VQVERVEQDAPHVVLALVKGAVADPDRAGAVIAGQMIEYLLGELSLAADPVHDLQVGLGLGQVGQEVEEVVGFAVKAEGVQAPQHERRVAQPGVAVVVVPLAARSLRQRRGRGGEQRARRSVDKALHRERRPLQVLAPRVVGKVAPADPLVPEIGRARQPCVRRRKVLRWRPVIPGQGAERLIAGLHPAAGDRARPLEAEIQVRCQPHLRLAVEHGLGLPVPVAGVAPGAAAPAVVEGRLALHDHVDRAVQAPHRPQQHPLGAVVGRHPPVRARPAGVMPPRPDQQHVPGDRPAGRDAPGGLEHHRARQVPAAGRDAYVRRPDPE